MFSPMRASGDGRLGDGGGARHKRLGAGGRPPALGGYQLSMSLGSCEDSPLTTSLRQLTIEASVAVPFE